MMQSRITLALTRKQLIFLLLITCFSFTSSAPTLPSSSSLGETSSDIDLTTTQDTDTSSDFVVTGTTPLSLVLRTEPTTSSQKSLSDVEKISPKSSGQNLDSFKIATNRNEMKMTTSEHLTELRSQHDSSLNMHRLKYDNGTIKIHGPHESDESSRTKSHMPSTIASDLLSISHGPNETNAHSEMAANGQNKNKSISFDSSSWVSSVADDEMKFDATSVETTRALNEHEEIEFVATTIEMPIKHDADNLKIMEIERDLRAMEEKNSEMKKAKLWESKKKALKMQTMDKKQKLKQKLFMDMVALSTLDSFNERKEQPVEYIATTEHYDVTTFSTSIKTAPTTIKSTTLTTIKSFHSNAETTTPLTKVELTTANREWPQSSILSKPMVAANEENQQNRDNVIVLNSNTSGLIVVDIMENFGKENLSTNVETFEIKMDLIDDEVASTTANTRKEPSDMVHTTNKDDIFLTTIESQLSSVENINTHKSSVKPQKLAYPTPKNDDIILINEGIESTLTTSTEPANRIKWNKVKNDEGNGNIKITFDNIDLPNQNVNVSIENGELVIDSIDISLLNRAEEELKRRTSEGLFMAPANINDGKTPKKLNKTDSLEIILIEDDSNVHQEDINKDNLSANVDSNLTTIQEKLMNDDSNETKRKINESNVENDEELHATTIHFEMPAMKHDQHSKKIELGVEGDDEDGIKIKTTDKDSDTIFYISNTEVKVIESIPPTSSPNAVNRNADKKYYPAIYEEDVIVDVQNENHSTQRNAPSAADKFEEDIVLSPLTSDFDPKDINYIGEAFLDVEESQNVQGASENHHIIPLTSDVVIQPIKFQDSPPVNIPIIGELPPQIELEEMVFGDDYDSKQQSNFRVEEYFPNFLDNRLVKTQLEADVPREVIFDTRWNGTLLQNRTHISVNTIINGTNMTTLSSPLSNATAFMLENDEAENADLNDIQTLFLACFATLAPLFLCVIIVLVVRHCWRKHRGQGSAGNDLLSDKSTDPLAEKNTSNDELKSTESGLMQNRGMDNMQASTELLLAAANGDITPTNNHNGTNGSIITMTLKNNHLIVETEERNDISRDTRETKMHYSPSEKDGVFIVEAARGADQNGSHKPSPLSQKANSGPLEIPDEIKIDTLQSHFTPSSPEEEHKQPKPEQVEVHTPPADIKDDLPLTKGSEIVICNGTKTGLSQSDLSLTSSNSSNQNYSYGDRDTYHFEEKGYKGNSPKRIINVHCHDLKPLIENSPPTALPLAEGCDKPVITSAIYKDELPNGGEFLKSDIMAAAEQNDILDKTKLHKINGLIPTMKANGLDEIVSAPDDSVNDQVVPPPMMKIECNGEANMDSLSFLPAPPPEEFAQLNEILEMPSMDSLPPPPPESQELDVRMKNDAANCGIAQS